MTDREIALLFENIIFIAIFFVIIILAIKVTLLSTVVEITDSDYELFNKLALEEGSEIVSIKINSYQDRLILKNGSEMRLTKDRKLNTYKKIEIVQYIGEGTDGY